MTWHLHYDDLIRHKIFKLLILAYFFNLIIWFGLRSIQNNIFIQNTRSLSRIFITAWYHLSKNQQIHMHISAQHHLASHSINSPKNKKDKSLDNRTTKTTLRTQSQKVSPLASSNFQSLSFDSPLLLRISRTSASSLLGHFASHPFSHFATEPCSGKIDNDYKYHNAIINKISDIHMFVTSSHTSEHAKLQYECKHHNTTINKKNSIN